MMKGKVVFITGATRGIGKALAVAMGRRGATVVVTGKSAKSTPELPGSVYETAEEVEVESVGGKALPMLLDVRDTEAIEGAVATTIKEAGRIDVLVNNAGALWWKPVMETDMHRYDLMNSINSRASYCLSRACLPHMVKQGSGHIIMQSPPIDTTKMANRVAYCISKFGMTLSALGIAQEMKGKGVSCNSIWPVTLIESAATRNHKIGDPSMWRKPAILVDAILAIVDADPNALTGQQLLDEPFLRSKGVEDFAQYRCNPEVEPLPVAELERLLNAGKAKL